MHKPRRELVAGSLALLAGCTGFTSSDGTETPENTETEDEERYSLTDLRINNERDQTVVVTVTLVPEGESDPSMELSVRLPPDDAIEWEDNPLVDDPGHVTVVVDDGTGEPERKESDWRGDTNIDNRGLRILIQKDGIVVQEPIA